MNLRAAIPLILLAALFNASQAAIAKGISPEISENVVVFGRFFVNTIFLGFGILLVYPGNPVEYVVKTHRFSLHCVRSISGLAAMYLYYHTLRHLSLSISTMLFLTAPLFVPFISRIWLKIPIIKRLWWGILISFGGLLLILKPGGDFFKMEVLTGLLAGLCLGISNVSVRRLHRTENSAKIMFYYFLAGVLVSSLFFIFFPFPELTPDEMLYLGLLGILTTALQGFFTAAYKFAPARLLTPFLYMSVVFALILDVIFWNNYPDMFEIFGMILIGVGTILSTLLYPKNEVIK